MRFIEAWYAALRAAAPELTLRRNYPYSGVSDALVTHLRRRYGSRGYVGMELEVNQKHVGGRALALARRRARVRRSSRPSKRLPRT